MAVGADMGGTTFDISIIDQHLPKTTTWGGVTNYPIKLPMVDLKTIGAGGGSIAWVDEGGALQVGPQSAGSSPGPACYRWGGTLPTVSDANLVLGRLNPDYFLGGKLPLYPDLARKAIQVHVVDKTGLTLEEASLGIIWIVNANMAKGISGNSVEKGYDLREFALVAMGGAAALHAAALARPEGTIVDILADPEDRRTISALLKKAVDYFKEQNVYSIECCLTSKKFSKLLKRFLFIKARGVPLMLANLKKSEEPQLLTAIHNWHLTYGESDEFMLESF